MKLSVFLIVSVLLRPSVVFGGNARTWAAEMVLGYFRTKYAHFLDAFVCDANDGARLIKHANRLDTSSDHRVAVRIVKEWLNEEGLSSKLGIFFDLSCPQNMQLMKEADQSRFLLNYAWLIWDPSNQYINLNSSQSLYSDVVVTSGDAFYQITNFTNDLPPESHEVGIWSNETTTIESPSIKPNLNEKVFKTAYYVMQEIYDPNNVTNQMMDMAFKPGFDSGNRFGYSAMFDIAKMYNFRMELFKVYDWGELFPNGTWTGVIGSLQSRETDMSITPLFPNTKRLPVTKVPPALHTYWFALVFKQPRKLGTYKAQTLELTPLVWALTGVFAVAGAVFFSITFREEPFNWALPVGVLQVVGCFANQGLCLVPENASSRIVCLSLLLVGLLVSNYYNAATMTALLSEAPPEIKNFDQFLETDIPINMVNASYSITKLGRSHVFVPKAWHKVGMTDGSPEPKILSVKDGLESIRKGGAFVAESFVVMDGIRKTFTDDEKCSLTVLSPSPVYPAFRYIKRDNHLLEMFSRG